MMIPKHAHIITYQTTGSGSWETEITRYNFAPYAGQQAAISRVHLHRRLYHADLRRLSQLACKYPSEIRTFPNGSILDIYI
jgi:hypothetical protein